jgi:hypothetical protein
MSWHHPDLYFFFCLAASLAASLAPSIIDDELLARRRKPPVVLPLDGLPRDRPARQPNKGQASGRAISVGFARASRPSRQSSKQAACVNISESSEERAPAFDAGSHPARFNDSNSAHVRACRVEPSLLAATNKCLALSNKSCTRAEATKKRWLIPHQELIDRTIVLHENTNRNVLCGRFVVRLALFCTL